MDRAARRDSDVSSCQTLQEDSGTGALRPSEIVSMISDALGEKSCLVNLTLFLH